VEEVHLDIEPGHDPREGRDLASRERRDVAVDAHDRVSGREEPLGRRPFGPSGPGGRALAEEVVERLPTPLGDEPFRNDQAVAVGLGESVPHF
jgi:hypothetical protein